MSRTGAILSGRCRMKLDYEAALALAQAFVDATLDRTWTCVHCGYREAFGDPEEAERRRVEHEAQCAATPSDDALAGAVPSPEPAVAVEVDSAQPLVDATGGNSIELARQHRSSDGGERDVAFQHDTFVCGR